MGALLLSRVASGIAGLSLAAAAIAGITGAVIAQLVGAGILLAYCLLTGRQNDLLRSLRNKYVVLLSVMTILNTSAFATAVTLAPAAQVALLGQLAPLFALLLAWHTKARVVRLDVIAIGGMLAGAAIMSLPVLSSPGAASAGATIGLLLAVAVAANVALMSKITKHLVSPKSRGGPDSEAGPSRCGARRIALEPVSLATVVIGLAPMPMLPFITIGGLDNRQWMLLTATGVAYAIANSTVTMAMRAVSALHVVIMRPLSSAITAVGAVLLLDSPFTVWLVFGSILILASGQAVNLSNLKPGADEDAPA